MGKCFSTPDEQDGPLSPAREQGIPLPTLGKPAEPPETRRGSHPDSLLSNTRIRSGSSSGAMSTSPLHALRSYATIRKPSQSIPASTLLFANPGTLAIFDAYPKAKYHFLVLPRYPFPPQANPESATSIVRLEHLDDLKSLLTKTSREVRDEIIGTMLESAREVEEMIRDEMVKVDGFEWNIQVGFHAIPSMKHVHLHVISEDHLSTGMKTKKHYNSFRPDLGFFIPIREVQRWLELGDEYVAERVQAMSASGSLLDSTLSCFKCDEPFHNMPKLKAHLEKEFEEEKKKALLQIRRYGRQRASQEDEDDMF